MRLQIWTKASNSRWYCCFWCVRFHWYCSALLLPINHVFCLKATCVFFSDVALFLCSVRGAWLPAVERMLVLHWCVLRRCALTVLASLLVNTVRTASCLNNFCSQTHFSIVRSTAVAWQDLMKFCRFTWWLPNSTVRHMYQTLRTVLCCSLQFTSHFSLFAPHWLWRVSLTSVEVQTLKSWSWLTLS